MTLSSENISSAEVVVSVIITNYNYARFLRSAIDSILNQDLAQVECIVVDDGSTDGSQEIIKSYPGVTALFQSNQGQAAALRAGARLARGKIIISLDADDFLYPDACRQVVAAWRSGMACLNYRLDVVRGDERTGEILPSQPFLDKGHLRHLEKFGYYPSPPMSGNAFAADYLRLVLDKAVHLDGDGVDAYLIYAAPVFGDVGHVDASLGGYRMHGDNISMSSGRKTIKNLGDHIYYQYWAEKNVARFAAERSVPYRTGKYVKGPYLLLWYLCVKDGDYTRWQLPEQGRLITTLLCLRAFLIYPNIRPFSRFKNVVFVAALGLMPRTIRRLLERQLVDFGQQAQPDARHAYPRRATATSHQPARLPPS
jgi:glycosyltransferase involved in cell wall biosynthesis